MLTIVYRWIVFVEMKIKWPLINIFFEEKKIKCPPINIFFVEKKIKRPHKSRILR